MLKIGIIGFGRMGITHYSILNTHPSVKIVGIADNSKFIWNVLKPYLKEVNFYLDYKSLLDNPDIDAVIISTPPNHHHDIIKYAFFKGIHVFCEKPFTADKFEAEYLANLFEHSKIINQVGYANRFREVFNLTKSYIDSDVIGNVLIFRSEMLSNTVSKKSNGDNWRDNSESGGGVVFEMASHLIDLNNYFFGVPLDISGTFTKKLFSVNVDDVLFTNLTYENGISGSVYVNWSESSYRKPMISIEIFGQKGKIIADFYGLKLFLNEKDESRNLRKGWNNFSLPEINGSVKFYVRGNEFTSQLFNFVDSIIGGLSNNESNFRDAFETHKIIEKINVKMK
jgi:predicted dehydrogenase